MTVIINNPNALNIFNWMFKRNDNFDQIVFQVNTDNFGVSQTINESKRYG